MQERRATVLAVLVWNNIRLLLLRSKALSEPRPLRDWCTCTPVGKIGCDYVLV